MAAPGWYPDPERPDDRLRWWDGRSWTDQTSGGPDPSAARRPRWLLVLALLVVLVLLAVAVHQLW